MVTVAGMALCAYSCGALFGPWGYVWGAIVGAAVFGP